MITSKVTQRGQTTLPRRIRDALNVKPGQTLVYEVEDDHVIVRSHPGVMASFGALKRTGQQPDDNFAQIRASTRKEWTDHVEQEGVEK